MSNFSVIFDFIAIFGRFSPIGLINRKRKNQFEDDIDFSSKRSDHWIPLKKARKLKSPILDLTTR